MHVWISWRLYSLLLFFLSPKLDPKLYCSSAKAPSRGYASEVEGKGTCIPLLRCYDEASGHFPDPAALPRETSPQILTNRIAPEAVRMDFRGKNFLPLWEQPWQHTFPDLRNFKLSYFLKKVKQWKEHFCKARRIFLHGNKSALSRRRKNTAGR